MSQQIVPFQPSMQVVQLIPYNGSNIIVSGEQSQQPAASAQQWVRMGHHIYAENGAPIKVINWNENAPKVLAYVAGPELLGIPHFRKVFNIADWKYVYQPQIRQMDYWAGQMQANIYGWRGNYHQRETHGQIYIEKCPPQTLTVAEQACLNYIQQGEYLLHIWKSISY